MFIHVFKRIKTWEKWTLTWAALAKAKEGDIDPTMPASVASEGRPIGNTTVKLARYAALAG
jgi:hypothetical protein